MLKNGGGKYKFFYLCKLNLTITFLSMKRYFLFLFLFLFGGFVLVAQSDTLLLPFNATTLTNEQKASNTDYLAYQVSDIQSNQLTDCMEAVDLGLSVLWATCNVGASAPEDYGDYFAWGETKPKEIYDWSTYKYCKGTSKTITKYCNNSSYGYNGFTDNKIVLDPEDDAATANWGGPWRMPTDAECIELCNNCKWRLSIQNGVQGYKVTGTNGNSIFLPAAGFKSDTLFNSPTLVGTCWSSSPVLIVSECVTRLYFDPIYVYTGISGRHYGLSVRPVYPKELIQTYEFVEKDTICGNELPYIWRGKECNVAGVYYDSLKTALGGDSVYVLELTVLPENECNELSDCIEAVDLGLSVLWATCNVGASTPEDYGDHFAWGETKPKGSYDWDTYKFGNIVKVNLTKYNNVDGLTTLALEDDAAAVNWGGYWRMPTVAEMEELFDNCAWTWTTQNGTNGYRVTGRNGKSIFLPIAGFMSGNSCIGEGENAGYWTNELASSDDISLGAHISLSKMNKIKNNSFFRYRGYSIRPVCIESYVVEDTVTVCYGESYMWNGKEYSKSGVYTDTLQNIQGGDSILMLNLTVLPEVIGTEENLTICYGESYKWCGVEYSESGVYRDTLQSAQGCDSIVTLNLTVLPSYILADTITIQEGDSYLWRGDTYEEAGVYSDSLLTINGCDSVYLLTLIVEKAIVEDVVVDAINIAEQCAGTGVMEVEVTLTSGVVDEVSFEFSQAAKDAGLENITLPYNEQMQVQYTDVRAGRYKMVVMGLRNDTKAFEEEKELTFLYPSTVLKQLWNDVVAVLTHDYNGGYNFVDFKWYKNGLLLSGETHSYICQQLEFGAEYSALLTEDNGTQLMTCPLIATEHVDISLYPTLLNRAQRINCNVSETSVVYIYDMMGNLILEFNVASGETELEMPYTSGVYMVKIVTASSKVRNIKLIVR